MNPLDYVFMGVLLGCITNAIITCIVIYFDEIKTYFKTFWKVMGGFYNQYMDWWSGGLKYTNMKIEMETRDLMIRALTDGRLKVDETVTPEKIVELLRNETDSRFNEMKKRIVED